MNDSFTVANDRRRNTIGLSQAADLRALKKAIWALIIVVCVSAACQIYFFYDAISVFNGIIQKQQVVSASEQMEELYLQGKFDALAEKANLRITSHPYDDFGYFYLGLTYYQQEEWLAAQGNLNKAVSLDPGWSDRVSPYLEEINANIENGE